MAHAFAPLTAVHYHDGDPGTEWTKDPWVALDLDSPLDSGSILTPNVVRLPGGDYRIYYTGRGPAHPDPDVAGYILSARSDDAEHWTKEDGIRVDLNGPHATTRTLCPDVVPLPEGGWRMYYEARSGDAPTFILSAVSADGLRWDLEEGVRIGDGEWSYGTPRCLYLEDGRRRLYFHRFPHPLCPDPDGGKLILSALSTDGLNWVLETGARVTQEAAREGNSVYSPEVIRLGDGSYRMYYAAWSEGINGGVFTATSTDGLAWHKEPDPCLDLGAPLDCNMVSEPCVTELSDGRFRLFYEARDREDRRRILSATSSS